jgi:hypothetical protein
VGFDFFHDTILLEEVGFNTYISLPAIGELEMLAGI